MGKFYMWGTEKTIALLDAVQRWDVEVKETVPKGRGKWQWVAGQLFVPDEEWDLYQLSKRCERRVARLKTNYEAYSLQLILEEENSVRSPSPMKFDGEVWNKLKIMFGELKSPYKLTNLAAALTATVKKENEINDDEDCEDEPAAISHGQLQQKSSSSSSSVGSNRDSYHDSELVSSPATFSRSSSFGTSSFDGHASHSDGLAQTTATGAGAGLNNEPLRLDHDSSSEFSHYKKSTHSETSRSWESSSKDSDHDETSISLSTSASKYSFRSVPEIAAPQASYKSLIENFNSLSPFPSPKALNPYLVAEYPEVHFVKESDNSFPSKSSTETSRCSACCSSCGKYCGISNSFEGLSAAAARSGVPAPGSQHGGSLSWKSEVPRDVVVYSSDHLNIPQNLQQLPARLASLTLNPPPCHECDEGHPVLAPDDDLDNNLRNDERSQTMPTKSKEHPHDRGIRNRIVSSPSSSRFRSSTSGPEPSSSSSFLDTSGKDDNVNLMVYIELNSLKHSEAG